MGMLLDRKMKWTLIDGPDRTIGENGLPSASARRSRYARWDDLLTTQMHDGPARRGKRVLQQEIPAR
jgi:hypothetical protein